MLGVIFNFDSFDEPYNQVKVRQGFNKLDAIAQRLNVESFYSFSERRSVFRNYQNEEYVVVHHSKSLSKEDKKEIIDAIKEILTVKKSEYRDYDVPKILVVFELIDKDNYYIIER